jgi:hypothetical protein
MSDQIEMLWRCTSCNEENLGFKIGSQHRIKTNLAGVEIAKENE